MDSLETCFKKASSKKEFAGNYLTYLSALIAKVDREAIEKIIDTIVDAGRKGNTIYFLGNGGSAVISSHFANDIGIGTRTGGERLIKAVSLVDNMAVVTAIANDEGYDNVFLYQLEALLMPDDIVFALSVSGNSANVVDAVKYAAKIGAKTICCTGFDGGVLKDLADVSLHIPTPKGEYGPVEDVFGILDHLIYSYLRLKRRGAL